jgi:hypothetical protein
MIHAILAQSTDLPAVPANTLKWVVVILVVIFLVACAGIVAWSSLRKPEKLEIKDEPAIEIRKAPKRYNHDLAEQRYAEHTRRLDAHDAEIEQLWTTMRSEDAAIRKETGIKFDAILLALGEIKGELKGRGK